MPITTFATLADTDTVHFEISWHDNDRQLWTFDWSLESDDKIAGTIDFRVTEAGVDRGVMTYNIDKEAGRGMSPTSEIVMRAEDAILARIGSDEWMAHQRGDLTPWQVERMKRDREAAK